MANGRKVRQNIRNFEQRRFDRARDTFDTFKTRDNRLGFRVLALVFAVRMLSKASRRY